MSHNGILASHSALRNFNFLLTNESMEYICKEMKFKSLNSLRSRINGIVPCDVTILNKMIKHQSDFTKNVATTFVGAIVDFDYDQKKDYYNKLLFFVGTKDYNKLSNKKKMQIIEEQKSIYKQINK